MSYVYCCMSCITLQTKRLIHVIVAFFFFVEADLVERQPRLIDSLGELFLR